MNNIIEVSYNTNRSVIDIKMIKYILIIGSSTLVLFVSMSYETKKCSGNC
jgi:hypothetical protein